MRTKPCEGVLRVDLVRTEPTPEVALDYDGLAGISERAMLRDIVEELLRKNDGSMPRFVEAVKRRAANVHVRFSDYVSYGIGGGDAAAMFPYPRTPLVWYEPARPAEGIPEHLVLRRVPRLVPAIPDESDRIPLERLPLA